MPYPLLNEKKTCYFHGLIFKKKHQDRPVNKHKKLSQNVWVYVFKGKGRWQQNYCHFVKKKRLNKKFEKNVNSNNSSYII